MIIKFSFGGTDEEEFENEIKMHSIISISPMKGCPSLIESCMDLPVRGLVLEKLGPSLEDLCNMMSPNARFDEKMTLAVAIQMVCGFFLVHTLYSLFVLFLR